MHAAAGASKCGSDSPRQSSGRSEPVGVSSSIWHSRFRGGEAQGRGDVRPLLRADVSWSSVGGIYDPSSPSQAVRSVGSLTRIRMAPCSVSVIDKETPMARSRLTSS
jgi:hypothetical protein